VTRLRWFGPRTWSSLFNRGLAQPATEDWLAIPVESQETGSGEFWAQLTQAVDPRYEQPLARKDVAVETLPGEQGAIVSEDKEGIYLHLSPQEVFLWERMDGTRTQITLVVDYCLKFKSLAPARITALVETLRANNLLAEPPVTLYSNLWQRLNNGTFIGRVNQFSQFLLQREFAISGLDKAVGLFYKTIGWLFYTVPVLIVLSAISLLGVVAFLSLIASGQYSIFGEGTLVEGATTLFIFQLLSVFLHELAHALTVKAFGRRVRRAGLLLLYGMPGAFVDTTDIWPAGKRAQLSVTWAGPFSNLTLGGLTAILMVLYPTASWNQFAFQFAISQYTLVVLNLTPFIRLDGYYLLADGLGIANLKDRSMGFLRNGLPVRLRQALAEGRLLPKLNREEKFLVGFGLISVLWVVNLLGLAVLTAPVRLVRVIEFLVQTSVSDYSLLTLFFTLTGALLAILLLVRSFNTLSQQLRNLAQTLQKAAAIRVVAILVTLALVLAVLPDLLAWQSSPITALIYAHTIALTATLITIFYGLRLTRELRGAVLQPLLLGLTLTALLLAGLQILAILKNLWPGRIGWGIVLSYIPFWRLVSLTPLILGSIFSGPRLFQLGGAALGWAALVALAAVTSLALAASPTSATYFPSMLGFSLLAVVALIFWALTHRSLALPRVATEITSNDPAKMLKQAVYAVAKELTQSFAEVAGQASLRTLAFQFNNRAADADWPLWITIKGALGEKMKVSIDQRAGYYRAALAELRAQIAAKLGAAFATHAQEQALAELPIGLRLIFHKLLAGEANSGEAAPDDDRVRVRLAGRRVAETLVIGCGRLYGWHLTDAVVGGFNRSAAAANWPMYVRGNGRLADELQGDLLTLSQVYGEALQDLLTRVAKITGPDFVERGVLQVYDSLPWEAREVTQQVLFAKLSWARRITKASTTESHTTFLRTVPLLAWLSPDHLAELEPTLSVLSFKAGQTVLSQGAYLSGAMIVRRGTLQAVLENEHVRHVTEQVPPGGLVGLRSSLNNQALPFNYVAQTNAELWVIPNTFVRQQLMPLINLQDSLDAQRDTLALLARIPLLAGLAESQRQQFAKSLESLPLQAGEIVVRQGEESQGFFIVRSGELEVSVLDSEGGERLISTLGSGEFFGETALLNRTPITATVRAHSQSEVLRLSPADFYTLLASGAAATLEQVQSRRTKERLRISQALPVAFSEEAIS